MDMLKGIVLFLMVSGLVACGGGTTEGVNSNLIDVEGFDLMDIALGDDGVVGDVGEGDTEVVLESVPPLVVSNTPETGATEVAFGAPITVTFSEEMAPETVTDLTFTLKNGTTAVAGEATCTGITAIFQPTTVLDASVVYTATISTGVTDLAGNPLAMDHVWSFTTWTEASQAVGQVIVPLMSASNFAILASAAITNIPTSKVTGDIGLTPDAGANVSGFSGPATCPELVGTLYVVDASGPACALIDPVLLAAAKADAGIAFVNARAAVRGTPQAVSGDLNGLTLYPGLYESGSSLEISPAGFLYLDAQGDGNAIFIIRSATSITTEATSEVVLSNGAKADNVYWTAGSSVTLGVNSIMKGTLLAGTSISLQTGANLEGRALNQGPAAEAITLDSCTITVPLP